MNAHPRVQRIAPLLAGLLVLAVDLAGQTVSARAVIAAPKSSVRVGGVTDRVDGVWGGVALDVHAGRFTLSGSGTRGQLTASQTGAPLKRDVGEMSLGGQYEVRPWLRFDLGYTARAFSSAAGYQRWDMMSIGATASRSLGTPAVRAFATLLYLPVVRVRDQVGPTVAVASDVGISILPGRSPVTCLLQYHVERFSFPAAAARSEQFETLMLSVGMRVRRVDGRWKLGVPGK
jgi:hypothetical protein